MPIPSFPSELLYPTMALYPSAQNLESILERGRDLDPEPRACGVETRTVAFCVFVVCSGRSGRELVDNYLTVAVLWRGREQGRGTKGGEGKG